MSSRTLVRSRARKKAALLPSSVYERLTIAARVAAGGAVSLIGLLLLLILVSYDPRDPSFDTALTVMPDTPGNWLGGTGAALADLCVQYFGIASFIFPAMLLAWGWRIGSGRALTRVWWRAAAGFGAVLAFGVAVGAWRGNVVGTDRLIGGVVTGALGHVIGGGLSMILPPIMGKAVAAPAFILGGLVLLYAACGLSLDEWQFFGGMIHGTTAWMARTAHGVSRWFWHLLHRGTPEAEAEEEEDEVPAEEAEAETGSAEEEPEDNADFEIKDR